MRNFDENNITDAVLQRVGQAPDRRASRQISEALVRHLHAFVREVEPTHRGMGGGRSASSPRPARCAPTRGRSSSCSRIRSASRCWSTPSTTGCRGRHGDDGARPVLRAGRAGAAAGADISGGMKGEPLLVEGALQRRRRAARRRRRRCLAFRRRRLSTTCSTRQGGELAHARPLPHRRRRPLPLLVDRAAASTRSPMTGRSARCWRRRAVTPTARRMCIS